MKIVNTSRLDTGLIRREFISAAKWARVSLQGVYVQVNNGRRSAVYGRFYHRTSIKRKGKRIMVRGYIKIFVHDGRTVKDITKTFVHELSHFKDYREEANMDQVAEGKEICNVENN